MRLLLIDTCGSEGSVALADDGGVIAKETLPGRSASERLIPVLREMLKGAGWRLGDLTAIVVVHGLSEAGGVPVVAVSQLALLAAKAGKVEGGVVAVLDAGRGEFYCGIYLGRQCEREVLLDREGVVSASAGLAAVVACEERVAEALVAMKPQLVAEPGASDALPFAVERVAAGRFDDVAALDANYLRRTDAEIFAKPKQGVRSAR
jgi:tRNA threonylcarbamoyladenosine biosynthesis protein TsaB